jgi:hypothetical protein
VGKGGRCVGLTTLAPLCADCLEIWEPQPSGTLTASFRPVMGLLYLYLYLFYGRVCVFYPSHEQVLRTEYNTKHWAVDTQEETQYLQTIQLKPQN